ncbi:unnamed protein product [Mycena citricolor]|uniref:Autophagy-related protein n=1 Tax=Mycena citricolor TaxID=2018698 RepID=A0AAD2GVV9_9AGAR|nr:unnamed protein product [Mycena citricolor]
MSRLPQPVFPVANVVPTPGDEDTKDPKDPENTAADLLTVGKRPLFVSSMSKDEPVVTRRELWSYYLYCNGDNGVGPNGFSMTLFQSLAFAAGYDPIAGPGTSCSAANASGQCVVPWGRGHKSVTSVVLVANGVSFAAHSNIGYIATLCLNLTILLPLSSNGLADNYTIVLTNMYWVLTGIWWFVFQAPRPGPPLPKGKHYMTIGWKQIWAVCNQYKQLPYTFIYLFAFFLLADGLNTTGTLVSICQNDKFSFSFLQNTYLGLSQAITSTASTFGFWYIQRYWKISTKRMFVVTNCFTIMIPLWGMIGIWTQKLGFHNKWEFWAYNVVFGLFQAPYYAFSQTMMAELTPPGFDNMFFGLFGLSNRASSMIGPNVIQAIIDSSGNNWMGFPFLFALCVCASLVIWFAVDVEKGRRDAVAWAESIREDATARMQ